MNYAAVPVEGPPSNPRLWNIKNLTTGRFVFSTPTHSADAARREALHLNTAGGPK